VIEYRTFRNGDPPALVELWNECFTGRGAAPMRGTTYLEYFTLAKPYFDPAGLLLAFDGGRAVGFAHVGFGPTPAGDAVDRRTGVVCALGVRPGDRRRGVGTELLRRCEDYLRAAGAAELHAGPLAPLNPFTFGLYGGSTSAGFLDSDADARAFLERRGYRPYATRLVLHRALDAPPGVADGRFPAYRPRFEIHAGPRHKLTWWEEGVIGPVELHEFKLVEKGENRAVARASLWEMETYNARWNQHAVGLVELETAPEFRRRGLAKFLLAQLMLHLHEQFFTLLEAHAPEGDAALSGLFEKLGFRQVDTGRAFRRDGEAGPAGGATASPTSASPG
jgi:ribosomal protein S18 acetylase RimI-like enzyme